MPSARASSQTTLVYFRPTVRVGRPRPRTRGGLRAPRAHAEDDRVARDEPAPPPPAASAPAGDARRAAPARRARRRRPPLARAARRRARGGWPTSGPWPAASPARTRRRRPSRSRRPTCGRAAAAPPSARTARRRPMPTTDAPVADLLGAERVGELLVQRARASARPPSPCQSRARKPPALPPSGTRPALLDDARPRGARRARVRRRRADDAAPTITTRFFGALSLAPRGRAGPRPKDPDLTATVSV